MKIRFFINAIIISAWLSFASLAQTVEQKADELINAYTKLGRFSGSVLVAKDGKILLNKGYGMANYELDVRNTSATKFQIASVTKQFTAMAIMQLQERGLLNVNDKIAKYLPDYPKAVAEKVTIHQLLSHTSGLYSFFDEEPNPSRFRLRVTLDEVIALFKDKPLEFEPGTKFKYSDSGYILLTAIIEKVSEKTWNKYFEENIFQPLGMKNTGYDTGEKILKNRAAGYDAVGKELINAEPIDISFGGGAGALYSTVEDLYLWDRALYTEKLVKRTTLNQIFTPIKNNYGYGWAKDDLFGHQRVWHNGGYPGFNANISRLINDDLCIVILGNRFPSSADAIAKELAAIILNQPYQLPEDREEITVNPQILDKYIGEYQLASTMTFTITRDGEKLMLQPTGQPKLELYAESETKFFLKVVDAKIIFTKNEKGEVTGLVMNQGEQEIPVKKVK